MTVAPAAARSSQPRRSLPTNGVGGVVIGGDFNGLGIVRSLGRHGIPVCVVDDERSIARRSRYTTHSVSVPDLRDEQRIVAALIEIRERLKLNGWVLYPTREEIVAAIAHSHGTLSRIFRVPTPSWRVARWACDKRNTYTLAAEHGVPTPRTWYPRGVGELHELGNDFPVAIKPAIKEHFIYATKAKAWRADDRAELIRRFDEAAAIVPPGEVMVQELIPGDGRHQFAYCAFFAAGEALGSMTVRRLRQHPPQFGRASTHVETVDEPELASLSERLLRAIDYYGLVELEYKRDPRDGELKLLDFNPRTWGYHSLGPAAGVDFPYLLYLHMIGQPVERVVARAGVRWVRLVTDLPTGLLELSRRNVRLRDYLASLVRSDVESVFCSDDPLPGVAELALVPYLIRKSGY